MLKLATEPFDLVLKHPFNVSYARTASGSPHVRTIVYVHLEFDGVEGVGEASPSKRYGETPETIAEFVRTLAAKQLPVPFYKDAFLFAVDQHAPGNTAAKCAVDIAWHDWWLKRNAMTMREYLQIRDLPRTDTTLSSFTIGIDDLATIEEKVREAEEYPILKVKLGTPEDKEIISSIRSITSKPLRIDANEGWQSKEFALTQIEWLAQQNVELIEQPLPVALDTEMPWLKERSPLPIYADESCGRRGQFPGMQERFHGVNIKLMKTTGIGEAIRLLDDVRETEMKIMIGCFIESSLAVTAAAHFAHYVDCADLDGAALCANDPYRGATIERGVIVAPDVVGIGATRARND